MVKTSDDNSKRIFLVLVLFERLGGRFFCFFVVVCFCCVGCATATLWTSVCLCCFNDYVFIYLVEFAECVCFFPFPFEPLHFNFSKMRCFSGLRGWMSWMNFWERWSISRGDRRGRVWWIWWYLFSWTNSPPFRFHFFAFRLKPGGFLRELSVLRQRCLRWTLLAEVGEPRHAVGVQFFTEFPVRLMVAGKMRTPPW
jgi:hypothetical protein